MGFAYFPPAGVAVESDPTALKIANNLSDLGDASTARSNLELGDLAEFDLVDLDLVPDPAAIADGHVVTADGLGGYAWEAPAAAGGNWIRETVSAEMPAPAANDGSNIDIDIPAGGPGPYLIEDYLIVQTGGDYAGGTPSLNLSAYVNSARSVLYWGNLASPPAALPSSGIWGNIGWDYNGGDDIHLRLIDLTFSGHTVQYEIFLTIRRPAGLTDNT